MERAQPETDLKEQRHQKGCRIETHPAQAAGERADPEGTDAQEPQIEDRILALPRMPNVKQ